MTCPLEQLAARYSVTDVQTGRILLDVVGLVTDLLRDELEQARQVERENEGSHD